MAPITINGNTIDAASAPHGYFALHATNSNYIIIQLANGIERCDAEQFRALHRLHVNVQEFLGHESYICRYVPSELKEVRNLSWIDHANVYHEDFKIHPVLQKDEDEVSMTEVSETGKRDPAPGQEPQMIRILLHDQADQPAQHVVDHINKIPSGTVQSFSDGMIYATVAKKDLASIAAFDGVSKITPRQNPQCTTAIARGIMGYNALAPLPLALNAHPQLGGQFKGANQVVGVADTGFDNGDIVNPHPAFNGRITRVGAYTRRGLINDETGHGTHVAGCVLGFAGAGPWRCHGTAPLANLHFQALADDKGELRSRVSDTLFDEVLSDPIPAYIHNMSYEDTPPTDVTVKTYYEGDAPVIDRWLYKHPEFTSVIASGNRGDGKIPEVIYSGTAKNVITVGASVTTRSISNSVFYKAGFWGEVAVQNGGRPGKYNNVAKWSSPGKPGTLRKPDVVAPGVCILSAASRDPKVRARPWHSSPVLDEAGVTGDDNYMFMNGTSMAAPLVAGHIAVLREAYIISNAHDPTSAMLKALLIHGAEDLSLKNGIYEKHWPLTRAPNNVQGFGLANLPASLSPILNSTCIQETLTGDPLPFSLLRSANGSGSVPLSVATFTAPDPGTFRATMVHIDFEGPNLQHDVRMRVTVAANLPEVAISGQVTTRFSKQVARDDVIQIDIYAYKDIPVDHIINYAIVWGME